MSVKNCLALGAVIVAGVCLHAPTPAPVLHVPSACVNQAPAPVSVSGSKIHLVKYHGQIEPQSFAVKLKPGQHLAINVVVLAGSNRYVLHGGLCSRGARFARVTHSRPVA
jgi:hypothetical protein